MVRKRRSGRSCGQPRRSNRGSFYPTSKADWKCHLNLVEGRKASRPTGGFFRKGTGPNRMGLSRGGFMPNRLKPGPGGATYCQFDDKQMKYRGDGPVGIADPFGSRSRPIGRSAGAWRTSPNWWVS